MAGNILKTLGAILLVVGILAVLAGAAAAGYGYMQERDNQEKGLFGSGRESEQNKEMVQAGIMAGAAGLVVVLISIVLLVTGGARSQSALRREIRTVAGAAAAGAAAGAASGAAGGGGADATSAAAVTDSGTAASKRAGAGAKTTAAASGGPAAASSVVPAASGKPRWPIVAGVIVAIILVAVLTILVMQNGPKSVFGNTFGGGGGSDAAVLETKSFDGEVQNTFVQPTGGTLGTTGTRYTFSYTPPADTGRLILNLTWTPAMTGSELLSLQVRDLNGTTLASIDGTGSLRLEVTEAATLHQSLSIEVYPRGSGGFVVSQPFHLEVEAWSA